MIRFAHHLFAASCPNCRSVEFRNVGVRNTWERSLLWLLRPCRCCFCGHHVFLFRWQSPLGGIA